MVDVRKELSLIQKHIRQHNRDAGESVVWFEFAPLLTTAASSSVFSTYDYVYSTGSHFEGAGRRYTRGIVLPTIYVEEREDRMTYQEEGRQPTQNVYVAMLYEDVKKAWLTDPYEYQHHLNDMFMYDGRYYKIDDYHVRGRLKEEVVVGVQGYEVYIDQEFVNDYPPELPQTQDLPWPNTFPQV